MRIFKKDEGPISDIEELRQTVYDAKMPSQVEKAALKEAEKLSKMNPSAPMLRHLLGRIATHGETAWPTLRAWPEESLFMECLLGILLNPSGEEGLSVAYRRPEQVHASLNFMRSIIDTNPHHALQLGELSKRAGVTEKHLCRLFQTALGHAPMETFRLLKLQLAMALLGRSSLAIKEIADRCGFENPLYFTRCFTRRPPHAATACMQSRTPIGPAAAPPTGCGRGHRQGGAADAV